MVSKSNLKKANVLDPTWFIALAATSISLYINPTLADPFNSPKLWLLILTGSWLISYLIFYSKSFIRLNSRLAGVFLLILIFFLLSMLISVFFTETKFTAFMGEQQRRLGFLFYLFMGIFMLVSAMYFTVSKIHKIYLSAIVLATFYSIYGLLQYFGKDFIAWNNPYNSIILTLGNPNYASALMSILAILLFSFAFVVGKKFKLALIMLGLLQIILIVLSNSRQGLIAFGIGVSIFVLIRSYFYSKKLAISFLLLLTPIFVTVFLAMLQIGPLIDYIYKASVSIRGYYWRAGIQMFKSNLLTGIGIDSYGDFFKRFRETQYPLNYGFTITSDNAHNVPIQIFATAGIFTGIFYLILLLFIFYSAFRGFKLTTGNQRTMLTGIFSAWVAFQAQSIISIDNVGLSIWGWVLGGTIIQLGLGTQHMVNKNNNPPKINLTTTSIILKQKILSSLLVLISVIFCSLLYQGEKYLYDLTSSFNGTNSKQSDFFYSKLKAFDEAKLVEPAYRFRVANLLFQAGEINESNNRIEKLLELKPNSYDYLYGYAQIQTFKKNWNRAVETREKLAKIDPWNAENYFYLAQCYEQIGNIEKAIFEYRRILSFARNTSIGDQAQNSLKRLTNS